MKRIKSDSDKESGRRRLGGRHKLLAVWVLIACLGGSAIMRFINSTRVSEVVQECSSTTGMSERDVEEAFRKARKYNEDLLNGTADEGEYASILNTDGSSLGLIGCVKVPSIDLTLPIYHTSINEANTKGAGHMVGTSFPIGGKGTHAVITSHNGLATHVGFTNLEKLKIGDKFCITVLGRTVNYRVDQIKEVLPTETEDIKIDPQQDYVTLLTCTPYGINTHRLLVRGIRI